MMDHNNNHNIIAAADDGDPRAIDAAKSATSNSSSGNNAMPVAVAHDETFASPADAAAANNNVNINVNVMPSTAAGGGNGMPPPHYWNNNNNNNNKNGNNAAESQMQQDPHWNPPPMMENHGGNFSNNKNNNNHRNCPPPPGHPYWTMNGGMHPQQAANMVVPYGFVANYFGGHHHQGFVVPHGFAVPPPNGHPYQQNYCPPPQELYYPSCPPPMMMMARGFVPPLMLMTTAMNHNNNHNMNMMSPSGRVHVVPPSHSPTPMNQNPNHHQGFHPSGGQGQGQGQPNHQHDSYPPHDHEHQEEQEYSSSSPSTVPYQPHLIIGAGIEPPMNRFAPEFVPSASRGNSVSGNDDSIVPIISPAPSQDPLFEFPVIPQQQQHEDDCSGSVVMMSWSGFPHYFQGPRGVRSFQEWQLSDEPGTFYDDRNLVKACKALEQLREKTRPLADGSAPLMTLDEFQKLELQLEYTKNVTLNHLTKLRKTKTRHKALNKTNVKFERKLTFAQHLVQHFELAELCLDPFRHRFFGNHANNGGGAVHKITNYTKPMIRFLLRYNLDLQGRPNGRFLSLDLSQIRHELRLTTVHQISHLNQFGCYHILIQLNNLGLLYHKQVQENLKHYQEQGVLMDDYLSKAGHLRVDKQWSAKTQQGLLLIYLGLVPLNYKNFRPLQYGADGAVWKIDKSDNMKKRMQELQKAAAKEEEENDKATVPTEEEKEDAARPETPTAMEENKTTVQNDDKEEEGRPESPTESSTRSCSITTGADSRCQMDNDQFDPVMDNSKASASTLGNSGSSSKKKKKKPSKKKSWATAANGGSSKNSKNGSGRSNDTPASPSTVGSKGNISIESLFVNDKLVIKVDGKEEISQLEVNNYQEDYPPLTRATSSGSGTGSTKAKGKSKSKRGRGGKGRKNKKAPASTSEKSNKKEAVAQQKKG